MSRDVKVEDLKKLMQDPVSKPIIFPGVLLDNTHQSISNFEIAFDDILVFESVKGYYSSSFIFKERDKEMCEYCRKQTYGGQRCQCKKYYYCNDMCEERDRNFHYCRTTKKIYNLTQASCLGKVGLQNMGNTCYMNSGLQCLSNTSILTNYILNDQYLNDINIDNHLGSKGALITEFAALIKEMWYGSNRCVSP